VTQAQRAATNATDQFAPQELLGDAQAAGGRPEEARAAYQAALNRASDRADRKRIETKLKKLR